MSEPKYRYRLPPCPDYDVGCMEAWLEHMAQKGLHLDGASAFFLGMATFREGQPATVKYRLDAVSKRATVWDDSDGPSDAAVEIAEEMGWEYVCRHRNFDIYRSDDVLAPELNTDPQLQAQTLKAVGKRMRGEVFTALFWWILYPLLRTMGPIITAAQIGAFLTFWGWGLLIGQLGVALYRVWFLGRMRKTLLQGAPPRRPENLEKTGFRYRLLHTLHIAAAVGFFLVIITLELSGTLMLDGNRQPLADFPGEPPFPTIADLAPEEAIYREEYFGFNEEENTFAQWVTLLTERTIVWEENARLTFADGSSFTGGLYVEYYEAENRLIARQLAKSLFRRDLRTWNVKEIDLPELTMELDYARGTDRVFNTVILQHENTVVRAYFYNSALQVIRWEDWVQKLATAIYY